MEVEKEVGVRGAPEKPFCCRSMAHRWPVARFYEADAIAIICSEGASTRKAFSGRFSRVI